MKTTIGDVVVCDGQPDGNNPYRGPSLIGPPRKAALMAYRDGQPTGVLTFWHAPAHGGARLLKGPEEVDWRGMSS